MTENFYTLTAVVRRSAFPPPRCCRWRGRKLPKTCRIASPHNPKTGWQTGERRSGVVGTENNSATFQKKYKNVI